MNALWERAASDLTLEQVNHHEREGVLPMAFSFAHYMKATYSEPDWKMAAQELERAAQQGLAEAQLKLYSYYRDGYGVEPNQKKADALLAMAAANGC
jgi:TPR repeat protein